MHETLQEKENQRIHPLLLDVRTLLSKIVLSVVHIRSYFPFLIEGLKRTVFGMQL